MSFPIASAKELLSSCQSCDTNGLPKEGTKFVRNPIRFNPLLKEKLDLANLDDLIELTEAKDFREVDLSLICTDQKVVVRDKVLSLIEVIEAGLDDFTNPDKAPVLVRFEFEKEYIVRDGNHRLTAYALLGRDYAPVRVIHIKDSFLRKRID